MNLDFSQLNAWAIIVSTLTYFAIGSLWYSSVLFANSWMAESKIVPDKSKSYSGLFLTTFIITGFMVTILALFITAIGAFKLVHGLLIGALAGIGFAASTLGITFLYESRTLKLFLIDAGYHVVGLTVAGAILSIWR